MERFPRKIRYRRSWTALQSMILESKLFKDFRQKLSKKVKGVSFQPWLRFECSNPADLLAVSLYERRIPSIAKFKYREGEFDTFVYVYAADENCVPSTSSFLIVTQ